MVQPARRWTMAGWQDRAWRWILYCWIRSGLCPAQEAYPYNPSSSTTNQQENVSTRKSASYHVTHDHVRVSNTGVSTLAAALKASVLRKLTVHRQETKINPLHKPQARLAQAKAPGRRSARVEELDVPNTVQQNDASQINNPAKEANASSHQPASINRKWANGIKPEIEATLRQNWQNFQRTF